MVWHRRAVTLGSHSQLALGCVPCVSVGVSVSVSLVGIPSPLPTFCAASHVVCVILSDVTMAGDGHTLPFALALRVSVLSPRHGSAATVWRVDPFYPCTCVCMYFRVFACFALVNVCVGLFASVSIPVL